MVVLAVAILGLAAVFLSGLKMIGASSQLTGATNVGREFLETVKQGTYASTKVGQFDGGKPDAADAATGFPPAPYPTTMVDEHQYTLVVRCQDYSPTIRSIEVDVYWDRDSKATFRTMVHQ